MTLNDALAIALSNIWNAEKVGKLDCTIKYSSKVILSVLEIMKSLKYIEDFKIEKTNRGDTVKVTLSKSINKCCVIKPRYPVKLGDYEKFEKRFLPAKNMGVIIVSTNKGILTHHEAKEKKLGGRLLAYCY